MVGLTPPCFRTVELEVNGCALRIIFGVCRGLLGRERSGPPAGMEKEMAVGGLIVVSWHLALKMNP